MKNGSILTVFKKEMARFFGDKRLAFVTILLPGLLIYIIYTLLGGVMSSAFTTDKNYDFDVYAVNAPSAVVVAFRQNGVECKNASEDDIESIQQKIKDKKTDALVVFPENFEEIIENRSEIPNVKIYYNNEKDQSGTAFTLLTQTLAAYETQLSNLFDVNAGDEVYDYASQNNVMGKLLSSLLPMLLMIMLFTGALSVTPESIAGEKERGTIAALLVTPARRSGIALGKILALSVIALLSGLSTTLGVLLSIPKLLGPTFESMGVSYGFADYLMLVLIIISTVLMIVALLSIVSAYAKTVKEATSWASPLMFVLMGVSFFNMFEFGTNWAMYLIPFFNSAQCMGAIFAFTVNYTDFFITIAANLVYTALGVWGLTRMFDSERVVFGK